MSGIMWELMREISAYLEFREIVKEPVVWHTERGKYVVA